VAQTAGRVEREGKREKAHGEGSRARDWMTFRSVHTALFIYLHPIVLQVPDNVAVTVSE